MRLRLTGALLAAATLLATIFVGSASADTNTQAAGTTSANPYARTSLVLTLQVPRSYPRSVVLHCQPPGGSHPNAAQACREVNIARGNFNRLPGAPTVAACTMVFRPVVASVWGVYRGRWVFWQHRYANPCLLRTATGTVYAF